MATNKDDESGREPTLAERLEAARLAREEREKSLSRIFGGAKSAVDKRAEALGGLFAAVEKDEEPSPLSDMVGRANQDREARLKEESQLFSDARQRRAQEQKDMARELFGREAPKPEEKKAPPPSPRKRKPKA